MSKRANPTLIGAFIVGALALAVVAVLLLAGGTWFREPRQHVMYFEGAAQGLQTGAPVVFLGVKVGTVKGVQLGLDEQSRRFVVPVTIAVEPHSVRTRSGEQVDLRDRDTIRQLVDRGLRAQLRIQSLLTGQLYVDLDFHPDKPARFVAIDSEASEIPTIPTPAQELMKKLEEFPIEKFLADVSAVGESVNKILSAPEAQDFPRRLGATLKHLESLAAKLEVQGAPIMEEARGNLVEMRKALVGAQAAMARLEAAADRVGALASADSPMVRNLTRASEDLATAAQAVRSLAKEESPTIQSLNTVLSEISRAARALRFLAETLEQQPEAIVRGKRPAEGR
ncbi:MAG: MCE family protein [Betaproteobacteria bacterium]|nr:MCE family protein [Betaproteobacteria bacterium]